MDSSFHYSSMETVSIFGFLFFGCRKRNSKLEKLKVICILLAGNVGTPPFRLFLFSLHIFFFNSVVAAVRFPFIPSDFFFSSHLLLSHRGLVGCVCVCW